MRIEDRHRQIVEQVRGAGRVLVAELAEHFDVTPETIRRDLAALDRNGSLRKVHGGAIPAPALPETGVTQREQVNICAKQAIARAALERLDPEPGTTLLVDAGTTTGAAARLLPAEGDLTIITNSVLTAASLTAAGHTRVRILGGQLRGLTQAAVGPGARRRDRRRMAPCAHGAAVARLPAPAAAARAPRPRRHVAPPPDAAGPRADAAFEVTPPAPDAADTPHRARLPGPKFAPARAALAPGAARRSALGGANLRLPDVDRAGPRLRRRLGGAAEEPVLDGLGDLVGDGLALLAHEVRGLGGGGVDLVADGGALDDPGRGGLDALVLGATGARAEDVSGAEP